MPIWLQIIALSILVILACYTWSLRMDLKRTEEFLELSRRANRALVEKLAEANKQVAELRTGSSKEKPRPSKMPAFLSADDPMDALLRDVGKLSR